VPRDGAMTASSDAPPRGAADDGEKVLLLAGVADKPRRKRSYYRRLVEGDAISLRLFGAMAFLAIGAVAALLNVTVERVEDAPMSHNWIQNLAASGDPHASVHVAAGARESAADDSVVAVTRAARLSMARDAGAREEAERPRGPEVDQARGAKIETGRRLPAQRDAAARQSHTVEPTCSFRPHLTDDDVFACTKVLFNNPSLGSKEADPANPDHAPPWPINNTNPKASTPTDLRQEENRCRRSNTVDFDAGEHDRPYTLPHAGREKSFTAAAARQEFQREAREAAVAQRKQMRANARARAQAEAAATTGAAKPEEAATGASAPEVTPEAAHEQANPWEASQPQAAGAVGASQPQAAAAAAAAELAASAAKNAAAAAELAASAAATAASAASNVSSLVLAGLGSSESVYEDNRAFMYAFVHLHKCGGTFIDARLRELAAPLRSALGGAPALATRGDELQTRFSNYPLMDLLTPETRHYAAWRFRNREPKAFYSGDSLKRRYLNGERAFVKSSEAMGFCDNVDAPCVYLTVLREPVARFMSYYSYICLLGAEGHEHWPEEWVRDGRCSLNPLDFYEQIAKGGFSMIDLLAPGGDTSGKTRCRVEAAKRNLESKCMRFALLERINHGMKMMRETMPDLAAIGLPPVGYDPLLAPTDRGQNGSGDRLSPAAKQRLDNYKKDENMMGKLRELLKDDVEVYEFAVSRYDKQWTEPLHTC
jgi:hypothetical protein